MARNINIPSSRRTAEYSEISRVGNMYISSEVIMYSIKDVIDRQLPEKFPVIAIKVVSFVL